MCDFIHDNCSKIERWYTVPADNGACDAFYVVEMSKERPGWDFVKKGEPNFYLNSL